MCRHSAMEGKMFVAYYSLIVVILYFEGARGTPVEVHPESSNAQYTHCLAKNEPIQLKDPFNFFLSQSQDLILMSWTRIKPGQKEERLYEYVQNEGKMICSKCQVFEKWGLQINNVNFEDSATYKAVALKASGSETKVIQIDVAEPPQLESEKLSVTRTDNEMDQSVTFSCGHIADLGRPPVDVVWKASNGSVLPSRYENGYIVLTLPAREETGKMTCEINKTSPAVQCILPEDKPKWEEGSIVLSSKASSGDMTAIIAGVVVAVVVLIIIVVVIIVIVRKKRRRGQTYNAKEHEKKREDQFDYDNDERLLPNDSHYDRPNVGSGDRPPIYKGSGGPGPYMVSNISQESIDPQTKKIKAPKAHSEDTDIVNGDNSAPAKSGKFFKRGEKKKEGEDGSQPPKAKPRSIFLTPSMEELDKITAAVAGGPGSGAPGSGDGTQV